MTYFFSALILSVFFTVIVRQWAIRQKIVDSPDGARKQHTRPVPLLGGTAIFISFWSVMWWLGTRGELGRNLPGQLIWVFIGSLLLLVVGYFDDRYGLSARIRLLWSALAAILVIAGGVGLTGITNPLGGILPLDAWQIDFGIGQFVVLADILVFFWLMGMMYTVKILDGLDGLATGIILIGALMIFALSSYTIFQQPEMARAALVLAGACSGFLFFNFYPARIFLGEGGGLFLGFILGVLAVVSGGKIATALLVMGIPVFDLFRVIYSRVKNHQSIFQGDRRHLHFQLLAAGQREPRAVVILYAAALAFGLATLFLPSLGKIILLIVLGITVLLTGWRLRKINEQKYGQDQN